MFPKKEGSFAEKGQERSCVFQKRVETRLRGAGRPKEISARSVKGKKDPRKKGGRWVVAPESDRRKGVREPGPILPSSKKN